MRRRTTAAAALCALALLASGCDRAVSKAPEGEAPPPGEKSKLYEPPARVATLEDRSVDESSGIAASRRADGVFWTHNDSGDGPFLYAFDRKGRDLGRWRVSGAKADDWEDIAAGPGPQPGINYLYVGDIGDNDTDRPYVTVYRVPEPDTSEGQEDGKNATEEAEAIRIKYPDGRHNAEALMVHPTTGDLYIVTKSFKSVSGVYRLKAPFSGSAENRLERVGQVSLPTIVGGLVTGADIAPDGRRVVLCDYLNAYEMILPEGAGDRFDEVWKQTITIVSLGPRTQGEAVCYSADGNAILATSEDRPTPLIEVKRK